MIRFKLLLVIALVTSCMMYSQQSIYVNSAVELKKSAAVILSEQCIVDFDFDVEQGFVLNQKINRTIKINTQEGVDEAKLTIPYYSNKYIKEIVEIKEYKISRLVNDELRIIKVEKADNRKITDDFYVKEIDIADIQVGDLIEYTYTVNRNVIDDIPTWFFQGDLPKLKSTYTVKIPDNLTYLISATGKIDIKKTEEITKTNRTVSLGGFGESFKFKEMILNFTAQDIPALTEEPFVGNLTDNLASIRFDLVQFQYPNSANVVIPFKEEAVARDIYKNRKFGNELNQDKFLKKNFIKEEWYSLPPIQVVDTVYKAIQKSIRWDGEYSFLAKNGVKKTCLEKTGNSADINLMLIASLRALQIDTKPVVLSTRMNGKAQTFFAKFLNQVVARVVIDGKTMYLDATDKDAVVGMLPIEDLNEEGWVLEDDFTARKINTTPDYLSENKELYDLVLAIDGNLSGSIYNFKTMYHTYLFKTRASKDILSEARSTFEYRTNGLFLTNGVKKDTVSNGLTFTFDMKKFSYATIVGDKMIFKPFEFYGQKNNSFDAEYRNLDIDFVFPSIENYEFKIKIPDTYQIVSYKKNKNLVSKETGLRFVYVAKVQADNVLTIQLSMRNSKASISRDLYAEVKAFYQNLQDIIDQEVVIQKK